MNRRMWIVISLVLLVLFFIFWRITKSRSEKDFSSTGMLTTSMITSAGGARLLPGELKNMLNQIDELEKKADYKGARDIANLVIERYPQYSNVVKNIKIKLNQLNAQLVFSPQLDDWSVFYTVQHGDTLGKLAKRYNTTAEAIRKINGLKGDLIRPEQRLKVLNVEASIVVDLNRNILLLNFDGEPFKTYSVGTGRGDLTPVGEFRIITKLENPVWYKKGGAVPPDDPENILGTRWLGFDNQGGYGIHGTKEPETIGQRVSQGCVRMYNSDVEELYMLVTVGTKVKILK